MMSITIVCPKCRSKGRIREDAQGLSIKCPKCGVRFNAVGDPPVDVPQDDTRADDETVNVPPPLPEADWLYNRKGQQNGPVSFLELKSLAESGQLARTDMVWRKGTAEWVSAASVGVFHGIRTPPPLRNQPDPIGAVSPSHPLLPILTAMFIMFVFVVLGGVLFLMYQDQTRSQEARSRSNSETDMIRLKQVLEQ
jgi:hypothetical protein